MHSAKLSQLFLVIVMVMGMIACEDPPVPKPKAQLALNYAAPEYFMLKDNCPYTFPVSQLMEITTNASCSKTIEYPSLHAEIFLNYKEVDDNLDSLLQDAQKLTFEHTRKADVIVDNPFINPADSVYGMLYEVGGNAASNIQFYATDSTRHFLNASLYFDRIPNYDSLYPAVEYIKKDMRKMLENLRWRNAETSG